MFVSNWKSWLVSFYYCFYALPRCCLLPLRAMAHLLMGVMVYYRVQHENKAISSRFADLSATLCVAVYYRRRMAAELVGQQSFGCAVGRRFLCCRRRIFDSWVLLWRCRAALEAPHLMSRFITAFPPLLMPATWWFITVLQPPLTLITSRFIHLGGAFRRSALLPFLSSNASGFQLAKAVLFRSALWASKGFKADICMRIYRYIYIYCCHMHIVIPLYMKH